MTDWFDKVDFAWVGTDSNGAVGLFYVSSKDVPDLVRGSYSLTRYNEMTDYIIDELETVTTASDCPASIRRDVEKGLYVFEYDVMQGLYLRVAVPAVELNNKLFEGYTELLIDLNKCNFKTSKEIVLSN